MDSSSRPRLRYRRASVSRARSLACGGAPCGGMQGWSVQEAKTGCSTGRLRSSERSACWPPATSAVAHPFLQRSRAGQRSRACSPLPTLMARCTSYRGRSADTISAVAWAGTAGAGPRHQARCRSGSAGCTLYASPARCGRAFPERAQSCKRAPETNSGSTSKQQGAPLTTSISGSSSSASAPRSSSSAYTVRSGRTHLGRGRGGGGGQMGQARFGAGGRGPDARK